MSDNTSNANSELDKAERSIAYQPNLTNDGTKEYIDFRANRDSTFYKPVNFDSFLVEDWGNEVWTTANSGSLDGNNSSVDKAMAAMGFMFGNYADADNSAHMKVHGTTNNKMTFVLSPEQKAQYEAGQMPYGLEPLNPDEFSGGNKNFSAGDANDMLKMMRENDENGGCTIQLNAHEYEKVFGVPYIEPIDYQNDEQFGDALKPQLLRPGAQVFYLTDAEIRDIRDGKGFTALPTDLSYDEGVVADGGLFKSDSAALGKMAQGALQGRTDVKLYVFTPEEIALYNGRDKQEVINETLVNEEKKKEEAEQAAWDASPWGQLQKFISGITSKMTEYTSKLGTKINDLIGDKQSEPEQPETVKSNTVDLKPSDLNKSATDKSATESKLESEIAKGGSADFKQSDLKTSVTAPIAKPAIDRFASGASLSTVNDAQPPQTNNSEQGFDL